MRWRSHSVPVFELMDLVLSTLHGGSPDFFYIYPP